MSGNAALVVLGHAGVHAAPAADAAPQVQGVAELDRFSPFWKWPFRAGNRPVGVEFHAEAWTQPHAEPHVIECLVVDVRRQACHAKPAKRMNKGR